MNLLQVDLGIQSVKSACSLTFRLLNYVSIKTYQEDC